VGHQNSLKIFAGCAVAALLIGPWKFVANGDVVWLPFVVPADLIALAALVGKAVARDGSRCTAPAAKRHLALPVPRPARTATGPLRASYKRSTKGGDVRGDRCLIRTHIFDHPQPARSHQGREVAAPADLGHQLVIVASTPG
jgi:hypothetical protein